MLGVWVILHPGYTYPGGSSMWIINECHSMYSLDDKIGGKRGNKCSSLLTIERLSFILSQMSCLQEKADPFPINIEVYTRLPRQNPNIQKVH